MAVPVVATATWQNSSAGANRTGWDITFPAVVAPGDLILVWMGADGNPGTVTAPDGWTVKASAGGTTMYAELSYLCRGDEGGTVARITFATAESAAFRVLQIKGARWPVVQGVAASATGTAPNPPALTPADGAQEYLWLAGFVADQEAAFTSHPTNMPDGRSQANSYGSNTANGVRVGVAALYAGGVRSTLDPGAWTLGTSVPWRARTMAVAPGIAPVASFAHQQPDPVVPEVAYTDTSTEHPHAWAWTFGDGGTSTEQHPYHTYAAAGTYEVTLVATNHMGASPVASGFVQVTASEPPMVEGRPPLGCTIAGVSMLEELYEATWETGRLSWMDTLQPASATLQLRGQVDAELNATVILGVTGSGRALWTGFVTDVTQRNDPVEGWSTQIACTDAIGRMGQAEDRTFTVPAGTLATQLVAVAARLGFVVDVDLAPSTGVLPALVATLIDGNALTYLATAEQASNALVVLRPDGGLRVLVRAPVPATPPVVPVELSGPDSPSSWGRRLSTLDVVNLFAMTWPDKGSGDQLWDARDQASIDAYGTKSYTVDGSPTVRGSVAPADPVPVPFPLGLRTAMAVPRWTVPQATVPITDTAQRSLWVQSLDWIEYEGELWQLLRVAHRVDPWSWTVELSADATQNAITDEVDPPVVPPTGTQRVTVTLNAPSEDAQVTLTSGNVKAGAGAHANLAVGWWQSYRYRTLVGFDLVKPAGATRCVKATLYVTTSTQVQVGFGNSPQVKVQRITQAWKEGSSVGNSSSNAVIWPGPNVTDAGQITKAIPTAQDKEVAIDVTNMIEAWRKAGGTFHGFRIMSTNEDGGNRTTEFWSKEGAGGKDCRLVATFDVPAGTVLPGP